MQRKRGVVKVEKSKKKKEEDEEDEDEEEEYFDPTRNPFDPNDRGRNGRNRSTAGSY